MQSKSNNQQQGRRAPKSTTTLTAAQKQQVRAMLSARIESKVFGANVIQFVGTTGACYPLSAVTQGVGMNSRVGDALKLQKLTFSYTVTVGATGIISAADQYNIVRFVVFQYHADDAVAPVTTNILYSATVVSQHNYDNRRDYRILYDKNHVVYNTPVWNGSAVTWAHGTGGTIATPKPVVINLSSSVQYDSNGVTGAGNLYLLVLSDSAFSPYPGIVFSSLLTYSDA